MKIEYIENKLIIAGHSAVDIAKKHGTPTYVYCIDSMKKNIESFISKFSNNDIVCFAVKANSNQTVLKQLAQSGAGMDVVSGGEILRCIKAGVDPSKIIFSGVGKTYSELKYALETKIKQINVESVEELVRLNNVAGELGVVADIAIRVNPNVCANTHEKISTGRKGDKFGIDIDIAKDVYLQAKEMENINPHALAVHIGSQILTTQPFETAYKVTVDFVKELINLGIDIKYLDLGGGLGIVYDNEKEQKISLDDYAKIVHKVVEGLNVNLVFAPGRWVVGNEGVSLTKVEYIKNKNGEHPFVICDIAMTEVMRPTLYGSYHGILPAVDTNGKIIKADVVGPVCESGDFIAKKRDIATPKEGDFMAVLSTGAYGMVMASNYNTRTFCEEIGIINGVCHVIRKRQTMEELIEQDITI